MRAAQIQNYGPIDQMITVQENIPKPILDPTQKNKILIKTLAVSLAPGDCRVLSGKTRELQGPPSLPYVPCGDVCGVVVESSPPSNDKSSKTFETGQIVAARFHERPHGALGEYAIVHDGVCDVVPQGVEPAGAAALASSGTAALCVAERIRKGDRVIIFGAGGGVGSHLCQLAKTVRGARFVVGVGRETERLLSMPLNCDVALDYRVEGEDPFGRKEFGEEPFDVVIDLSGGVWLKILEARRRRGSSSRPIVKPASRGGRYLTTTPDSPIFEAHSMWQILKVFLFPALYRAFITRTIARRRLPKYSFVMGLPDKREIMTRALTLAAEGKMVPCIDGELFPFTTEGVKKAYHLQESRHAKGKVVIQVAKDEN